MVNKSLQFHGASGFSQRRGAEVQRCRDLKTGGPRIVGKDENGLDFFAAQGQTNEFLQFKGDLISSASHAMFQNYPLILGEKFIMERLSQNQC